MEEVILLENPRKKRRKSRRRQPTALRKYWAKKRRRRRNPSPAAAAAAPRRRRPTTVSAAPRRRAAANPKKKRRRRRSSGGGRVFSVRRITGLVGDAAGLAAAEFLGDMGARFLFRRTPVSQPFQAMGLNFDTARPWIQMILGLVGEPMLKMARAPRAVRRYWALANIASGLIAVTAPWRGQALNATGLSDWVEANRSYPAALAPPAEQQELQGLLSDWETVQSQTALDAGGDPFSL